MTFLRLGAMLGVLTACALSGPIGLAAQASDAAPRAASDAAFDAAYERLRRGPEYAPDVATGRTEHTRLGSDGRTYRYVLVVPDDYDPARRYPVAFYLHGGISRPDPGPGGTWWRNYDVVTGHDRIAVLPLSWSEAFWWRAEQVDNLRAILSEVKRTYNVDENRVVAFGTSDGGTGVYFLGFRDVTPWAAFLPFIAHPGVLMNPQNGADGPLNLANLTNRPFFIVNGETDPLYPVRSVQPFLDAFERVGVDFTFTAKPGGHDTRWWPEEETHIERFVEEHPRDPHPPSVLWATERTDRYNRAHWVVIDELGALEGDEARAPAGARAEAQPGGVLEAIRSGNTVTVHAYQVRRFRLLVSPDAFDLTRPITVRANGETVFEGLVRPDVATLERWAARDQDRTMLYAAEIAIELPPAAP